MFDITLPTQELLSKINTIGNINKRDWFDYITLFASLFTAIGIGLTFYFQFFKKPKNLRTIGNFFIKDNKLWIKLHNLSCHTIQIQTIILQKDKLLQRYYFNSRSGIVKDQITPCYIGDLDIMYDKNKTFIQDYKYSIKISDYDGSVVRKKIPKRIIKQLLKNENRN